MWTRGDAVQPVTPVWRERGTAIVTRSVEEVWFVEIITVSSLETFSILKMIAA